MWHYRNRDPVLSGSRKGQRHVSRIESAITGRSLQVISSQFRSSRAASPFTRFQSYSGLCFQHGQMTMRVKSSSVSSSQPFVVKPTFKAAMIDFDPKLGR